MDVLDRKYRRNFVKQDILDKVSAFIDKTNQTVNMKDFFQTYPYYRNKIVYYFGSMPDFYEEIDAKPEYKYVKRLTEQSQRRTTLTFRDELALQRLEDLRKQGHTLQSIADSHGVTKQAVAQLINMLDIASF